MNMKEFSLRVGLSAHTLRYYEKIGLMKNIQRNVSGHRAYTRKEIDWVGFIVRLKETGMTLENIVLYAQLREVGVSTVCERQKLLEQHKETVKAHIVLQKNHLKALEDKIDLYKGNKVV